MFREPRNVTEIMKIHQFTVFQNNQRTTQSVHKKREKFCRPIPAIVHKRKFCYTPVVKKNTD